MTARFARHRVVIILTALVSLGLGGIGTGVVMAWTRAEAEGQRADEAVAVAEDLCAQIEGQGWTCVHDPESLRGEAGPEGPPGPPPSDEAVYEAVEEFFHAHPVEGEEPSPAAIAAAVANYLTEHPAEQGERGPGPSAEQVAAAVREYLTANPPAAGEDGAQGPAGPQGERGETGRAPTVEEIAAAVEAYMTEHPLPACPAGSAAEPHTVLTTGGPVEAIVCVTQETEEN